MISDVIIAYFDHFLLFRIFILIMIN